jgi:hypothetical protein
MKDWSSCLQKISFDKEVIEVPTLKCLEIVFSNILTVATSLSVFALFVMLIVGGFRYLTSGGDPKATAAAQQTMTFAIIGIALMAIVFLVFKIIEALTGVNITTFSIPSSVTPAP